MGLDHQPTSGANENSGGSQLAREFSLYLQANPVQTEHLLLESSVALFCSELPELGPITLKGLIRLISAEPPHPVVDDIITVFYPCFDEGEEALKEKLWSVTLSVNSTIEGHSALTAEQATLTADALLSVILCQGALCLSSYNLTDAILDTEAAIQESITNPFRERVDEECVRMSQLETAENIPSPLKRKAVDAIYQLGVADAKEQKKRVEARVNQLDALFEPLTTHAVERLHDCVPGILDEYLTKPFKEAVAKYVQGNFETPFRDRLRALTKESNAEIERGLAVLREVRGG